ncbi:aminotransferase class I/II-fold pyridoxal phosphate-dependent enzyme [Aquirufa antheringensis]|uniref:Aminotransferase class I/II-fold pyridoxal phosphate-dependent enzyme n=1 Tax=Aquirufa antheringensis TaxID=2516559 RepID=A0A4Q9BG03_9BACT|nr:aminotransferase class I/II-fold pyridoxal phosphate-dependent enzyme [Aquirufa antheringensis]TBH75024.1 aminotransferase class I/II-fold pyridoxal phosphate-dependent enzyme [Aquirufa antheringensis]
MKKETIAVHGSHLKDETAGAIAAPVFLTTTFERALDGTYPKGHMYSRNSNPNRTALEKGLAALEGASRGFAFGSGLAAVNAVFQCLQSGDHILMPEVGYYASYKLAEEILGPWGLEVTQVDMTDLAAVEKAVQKNTKLIWAETPANPMLSITDIKGLSEIAKKHGLKLGVDNTLGTPVLQNPISLGADIVMHATTKYIGGHSDIMGGAVLLKEDDEWAKRIERVQILMGATPNPLDCYLLARGLKTLPLRMREHSANALELAKRLEKHPKVELVHYPGLESHPQHALAKKQMPQGFSGMIALQVKTGETETREMAGKLQIFQQATSLGGVESLVEHRKSIEGPQSTTPGNLLRFSIGLEHVDDLWADLNQALNSI